MSKEDEIYNEFNKVMAALNESLQRVKALVNDVPSPDANFVAMAGLFLSGIISNTADYVEKSVPNSAASIYADVEAIAKAGGFNTIKRMQESGGSIQYSVSTIDKNDITAATNYLSQQLTVTLAKGVHELPPSLRDAKMLLLGAVGFVANLLKQQFNTDASAKLDEFCKHVNTILTHFDSSNTNH